MFSRLLFREACWSCVERTEMMWLGGAVSQSVGGLGVGSSSKFLRKAWDMMGLILRLFAG